MPLVVVIEDDSASQRTLARLLRTGGYDAAVYASAEEFLSSPPPSSPIGILLDLHLGGMSGLDLQLRLKQDGSTIPVIIITAFDDLRSRERAERLGCVAFLRKPCEAETILALLGRLHDEDPALNGVPGQAEQRPFHDPNNPDVRPDSGAQRQDSGDQGQQGGGEHTSVWRRSARRD